MPKKDKHTLPLWVVPNMVQVMAHLQTQGESHATAGCCWPGPMLSSGKKQLHVYFFFLSPPRWCMACSFPPKDTNSNAYKPC